MHLTHHRSKIMRKGFSVFIILAAPVIFSTACKNKEKYPYAIRDFKSEYRPYLEEAVSKNLVGYDSCVRFIKIQLSDAELLKLSNSEHPTLRAVALEELVYRKSVDQFNVIKNHLDDTAIVVKDIGEFGVQFATVSDNMIMETDFRDSAEMQKVIELVMAEHTYLSSAYSILRDLKSDPEYYPVILEMTKRERPYGEISKALFALACYKKQPDIPNIKEKLSSSLLLKESFGLIQDFPDSSYIPLLEKYARRLYGTIYTRPYQEIFENQQEALQFIKAVAGYKNKRSADMLAGFLHRGSVLELRDTIIFRDGINDAILANPCPEYLPMIKELSGYILQKKKDSIEYSKHQSDIPYERDSIKYEPRIIWPNPSGIEALRGETSCY
jgi:hypothetical protein